MPAPARRAAPPADPGYPALLELADRRQALKLFALSVAGAALGLPLTGCPGPSSSGGPAPPPPATDPPDWLPWRQSTPMRLAGEVAAPMPRTVAVVVGGGPVEATLADGSTRRLVVAVVVQAHGSPQADASARAAADAELIRAAARELTPEALADAAALDAFEARLLAALAPAWPRPLEELSVGLAVESVPPASPAPRASREAAHEEAAEPAPPREAPPRESEARQESSDATAAQAASPGPTAGALWAPCRRPGCTSCGR